MDTARLKLWSTLIKRRVLATGIRNRVSVAEEVMVRPGGRYMNVLSSISGKYRIQRGKNGAV